VHKRNEDRLSVAIVIELRNPIPIFARYLLAKLLLPGNLVFTPVRYSKTASIKKWGQILGLPTIKAFFNLYSYEG